MDFKSHVRKGVISVAPENQILLKYNHEVPKYILVLIEGKAKRLLEINSKYIKEPYNAFAFLGIEDALTSTSYPGNASVSAGSHYILWEVDDFLSALERSPQLARESILALSYKIRQYDEKFTHKHFEPVNSTVVEIEKPTTEISDTLYHLSFSDDDSIPQEVLDKLGKTYSSGDIIMQENDTSNELYIILDGEIDILQSRDGGDVKIDTLGNGDMLGEMAIFDGLPRSATAKATTDVHVLVFKLEDFNLLFQLHFKWSLKILRTLAMRLNSRRDTFSIS